VRGTLSKDFSEENPYSKFALAQLRVSIQNTKTKVTNRTDGQYNRYEEVKTGKYSEEEFN